eukprot:IDg13489t1
MLVGQPSRQDSQLEEDARLGELELIVVRERTQSSTTFLQCSTRLSRGEVSAARCSSVRSVLQSGVCSVRSAPYSQWAQIARRAASAVFTMCFCTNESGLGLPVQKLFRHRNIALEAYKSCHASSALVLAPSWSSSSGASSMSILSLRFSRSNTETLSSASSSLLFSAYSFL